MIAILHCRSFMFLYFSLGSIALVRCFKLSSWVSGPEEEAHPVTQPRELTFLVI